MVSFNFAGIFVAGSEKLPEIKVPAKRRMTDSAESVAASAGPSRKRLFWDIVTSIVLAASIGDLLLFIFFSFIPSAFQHALNLTAFAVWTAILLLLKRRYNRTAMVLIWVASFTHTTIGTLLTGWDSGYYFYLVMFIPTIIIGTPTRIAYGLLGILLAFYMTLFLVMQVVPPIQPISHRALCELQVYNACVLFVMISYFVFMYHRLATKSEQDLKRLATTDALTGLFNRRYAREMALREVGLFERGSRDVSYIIADIDHFKMINDQFGHQVGDMALVAVSDALRSVTRAQDVLARWGGEEFLFVLPATPRAGAVTLANRVRDVLARMDPIPGVGTVTLTFGISSQRKKETFDAAIVRADKALYDGKRAGRNCVVVEPEDDAMPVPARAAH